MCFNQILRGPYNYEPDLESNVSQNWGGMMKILSSTANNLIEENIEFIEFWFNIDDAPAGAKFLIDLGQIVEDVIPNGKLDTEDKNQNDLVDEGEDTGIDGISDGQERAQSGTQDADPSGDNFFFNLGQGDYSRINGTEGNAALTDIGRLPDSEDLNRNFTIDRVDSYFRYEVPIDTNRLTNDLISGGGDNAGWYQFRIPLKDYVEKVGDPSFSVVEYIRLWISGVTEDVHVRFAEINLVGNQWQKVLIPGIVTEEDTVLTISTINKEDNPEYTSPRGVEPERDRSQPDQEVYQE